MPLTLDHVVRFLDRCESGIGCRGRLLIAYSGGRDSAVLLHLLSAAGIDRLAAVHVNHRLHPDAASWQEHCRMETARLGIELIARSVEVDATAGDGLEANARAARYAAFAAVMEDGDWLVTAHHADDQAETLLLNLLRGSGPAGLRGAARKRPLGPGWLLRPLLDVGAATIADYARAQALSFIDDPGNRDLRQDRNFLRHVVMPRLHERWPAAGRKLARSAALAREAAMMLEDQAVRDLATCGDARRLAIAPLAALPEPRQRNLLRHAAALQGLPSPPAKPLQSVLAQLLPARQDATPRVGWGAAEVRRYRDHLYLMPLLPEAPASSTAMLVPDLPFPLGPAMGDIRLVASAAGGISAATARSGLRVRYRRGGESLRPAGRAHHRPLKKLLQDAALVPWMRDRIPLIYAGSELVAVGDLWVAEEHFERQGFEVQWRARPALF